MSGDFFGQVRNQPELNACRSDGALPGAGKLRSSVLDGVVALHLLVLTCRRHYPGGPLGLDRSWDGLFQPFPCTQRRRPSPSLHKVRRPHLSFRGLLNVHSGYGLSARLAAKAARLSRRLRRFRSLPACFDSYRLERPSCRVGFAPTDDQHLPSTAHTKSVTAKRHRKELIVPRSTPPSKLSMDLPHRGLVRIDHDRHADLPDG